MITGILFNEKHKIFIDNYNKFNFPIDMINKSMGDTVDYADKCRTSVKDILYVRYDFHNPSLEDFDFLDYNIKIFKDSIHIFVIDLKKLFEYNKFEEYIDKLSKYENVVKFISLDCTELKSDTLDYIKRLGEKVYINRIILKDNAELDNIKYSSIKATFKKIGYSQSQIGLCGSPFTNENNCCVPLLLLKELISRYGTNGTAMAVSGYTMSKFGCSCVRYIVVDRDIGEENSYKQIVNKSTGKYKRSGFTDGEDVWF